MDMCGFKSNARTDSKFTLNEGISNIIVPMNEQEWRIYLVMLQSYWKAGWWLMNCSKIHAIWLVVPETIKLKHIFCKITNEKEITDTSLPAGFSWLMES